MSSECGEVKGLIMEEGNDLFGVVWGHGMWVMQTKTTAWLNGVG